MCVGRDDQTVVDRFFSENTNPGDLLISFWATAVGVVAAIIFLSFPGLDLWVAQFFYIPDVGFGLAQYHWADNFSDFIRMLAIAIGVVLILLIGWRFVDERAGRWLASKRVLVFLLVALVFGPGLTVNTLLKDNWGRARPRQIEMFGGTATFSPPVVIADQCERNCSFVAGDPSVGFYFVAFGLAFARYRKQLIRTGLFLGALFGLMRIAQGAHFFSDVIFSGVATCLVAGLAYHIIVTRSPEGSGKAHSFVSAFSPKRLD